MLHAKYILAIAHCVMRVIIYCTIVYGFYAGCSYHYENLSMAFSADSAVIAFCQRHTDM